MCQRDGSSKARFGLLRRRARIRLTMDTRNDSERTRTMTKLSVWITGVFVVICAFMCTAMAQRPTPELMRVTDKSQASDVLPSGLGDAVDRDVTKVRDATAKFKTTEAA